MTEGWRAGLRPPERARAPDFAWERRSLCPDRTHDATRLIVNADDFGQTRGINRAVLELHEAGLLTSATLMARSAATAQAIEIARVTPTLGVGCHIVLTDGEPILPPAQIPSLLDLSTNLLVPRLTLFLGRLFAGRIRAEEIQNEAAAQIQYLQSNGLSVTHVDTHKHTHMFPDVLRPVLRAARACGIHSVRNPSSRSGPFAPLRAPASSALRRCAASAVSSPFGTRSLPKRALRPPAEHSVFPAPAHSTP